LLAPNREAWVVDKLCQDAGSYPVKMEESVLDPEIPIMSMTPHSFPLLFFIFRDIFTSLDSFLPFPFLPFSLLL
jgi:hypothetical protein